MLAELYKLAYSLDQKGLYDEAKEIEQVMRIMAEKTGLTKKEMADLADHFDEIGDTKLADKFDTMLKNAG